MTGWFKDVDGRNKCGYDGEGVIPGEPQAREGDPLTRSVLWIPFPSAALRPGMTLSDQASSWFSGRSMRTCRPSGRQS
jgi:hypothetical protein